MEDFSKFDHEMMSRALHLAKKAIFSSAPNPAVGCVICVNGKVVGEGFTRPAGHNHAEVEALGNSENTESACVYVTLEPCSHQGRTGACAKALIDAKVAKVIISTIDPNPLVAGKGIQMLRDAGIQVSCGLLEQQAIHLNRKFIKFVTQGIPWVTVKSASSIDGRTAMKSGESQWITSPSARADVQKLRAAHCAIITGVNTVMLDNPSLNLRISNNDLNVPDPIKHPARVIIDSNLSVRADAKLFQSVGNVIIATLEGDKQRQRSKAFNELGVEVLFFESEDLQVPINSLLKRLAKKEFNSVLVESGATLAGSFVRKGLMDEFVCYFAPKIFGDTALPMLKLPIDSLDAHLALSLEDIRHIGPDIRMTFTPDRDY
jgi:diaminohydroxyphosphoribosylaminopyrimidine deaminase/5-amino-6-(5-phosphoribosylamino)uracil reductase